MASGACPPAHLAALRRLEIEDRIAAGHDPAALVAAQLGLCFQGRLPLTFAEQLLAGWEHDCWTRANLARLRRVKAHYDPANRLRPAQEIS